MLKNTYAGDISEKLVGKEVILAGWVSRVRDFGNLVFLMLRDRTGEVQITFDRSAHGQMLSVVDEIRRESVIRVRGIVRERAPENVNPKLPTGKWEIEPVEVEVLATAEPLPINLTGALPDEKIRLKYRYLDLRRPQMTQILKKRHEALQFVRSYLTEQGFWEIETPYLTKYTPGGARNFMVPAHNPPGHFYSLAESPQIYKQLLMIAGVERYFQIARCFRDEELRADRQPEFTQIDLEMSFVDEEDIRSVVEPLLSGLLELLTGVKVEPPFPVMKYEDAMRLYGSDKPDLRIPVKLVYLDEIFKNTGVKFIRSALERGGHVVGFVVEGSFTRSQLKAEEEKVKQEGAGGLLWIANKGGDISSPIAKFLTDYEKNWLREKIPDGSTFLGVVGEYPKANEIAGRLRVRIAQKLGLVGDGYRFVWIVEFPLFELNDDGSIKAAHHPFTMPVEEDIPLLESDPLKVRARAYDIVLNGYEVGGGSIRIHDRELQRRVFDVLGFEDVDGRFAFFLEAFKYGAPPHGGIALGLDRLLMVMLGLDSIRDAIAFPKAAGGVDPLTGAPAPLYVDQYEDFMNLAKEAERAYKEWLERRGKK